MAGRASDTRWAGTVHRIIAAMTGLFATACLGPGSVFGPVNDRLVAGQFALLAEDVRNKAKADDNRALLLEMLDQGVAAADRGDLSAFKVLVQFSVQVEGALDDGRIDDAELLALRATYEDLMLPE